MRGNRREHAAQPSVRAVQWGADVGAVGETGWRYGRQRGDVRTGTTKVRTRGFYVFVVFGIDD